MWQNKNANYVVANFVFWKTQEIKHMSLLESLGWKGHGGLAWIADHWQMSFLRYTNQIHVCLWKMWTTYRPAFQIYKCEQAKMQTMWWPISSFEKPKKLDTYELLTPHVTWFQQKPFHKCFNQSCFDEEKNVKNKGFRSFVKTWGEQLNNMTFRS